MATDERAEPRQWALRRGRSSQPGFCYSITKCTADRRPLLVADTAHPNPDQDAAHLVISAFRWLQDNGRIDCQGYVVMPDHFHLLLVLRPGLALDGCMRVLCGYTSRQIALRRSESASIWQPGYWDHAIRSGEEFLRQWTYLAENPIRKGLVARAEDWPYLAFRPWPSL